MPSVNADWLLTASVSLIILLSTDGQISFVQFQPQVGHLHEHDAGAIMLVVWPI